MEIPKPPISQREWYDGRKKAHVTNNLCVHNGYGNVVYTHCDEPGIINDITLLRRSNFYQNIGDFIDIARGDVVVCDGIWRHEGLPFLCRFCEIEDLSGEQTIFNWSHSEVRIISENYYSRMHGIFPMIDNYRFSKDKWNIWFRVFCLWTNVYNNNISPLRLDI